VRDQLAAAVSLVVLFELNPLDNRLLDAQQDRHTLALRTPFPVHRSLTLDKPET